MPAAVFANTILEVPSSGRGSTPSCSSPAFASHALSFTFPALPQTAPDSGKCQPQHPMVVLPLPSLEAAAVHSRPQKLAYLVASLGSRFRGDNLACVQVWTSCIGGKWCGVSKQQLQTVVMSTAQMPFCVTDSRLQDFRARSCQQGITGSGLGMLGKVMSSGVLQVVQNAAIIPKSVHPRNKLEEQTGRSVSELVYIPIYDAATPDDGVIAVLEVVISSTAVEAMLVANLISFVGDLLDQLQLSLSKPPPLPRSFSSRVAEVLQQLPPMLSPPSMQEMDSPSSADAHRMRCPSMARTTSRASFDLMR